MPLARICWVPLDEGGRATRFSGVRYVAPARFDEDSDKWPSEAWSLVVELEVALPQTECVLGNVHFLMDTAPQHLLHTGSKFTLYEGRRATATGEVL
jgi:hypothetical protein